MIIGKTPTLSTAAVGTIAAITTPINLLLLSIAGQLCVCAFVFIKLHITAQPGAVKLIFQCYSNGSALWGIGGVCVCVSPLLCSSGTPATQLIYIYREGLDGLLN